MLREWFRKWTGRDVLDARLLAQDEELDRLAQGIKESTQKLIELSDQIYRHKDTLAHRIGIQATVSKEIRAHIVSLETTVAAQGIEIDALKASRALKANQANIPVMKSWEEVQAQYAADPENYKES